MTVVAIVPAYNEAGTIAATLRAMRAEPIDRIIVVPNNCTDDTACVAGAIPGVEVMPFPGHNPDKKAGALNWALDRVLPTLRMSDHVLITDADSVLSDGFTDAAINALRNPKVGAACASFYADVKPGLLSLVQRSEYTRFARMVSRKGRAQVLSGVGTMFPVWTLWQIKQARTAGVLPGPADTVYHPGTATEDIELTFAVRKLGYKPVAPDACRAQTDTMPTAKALFDQRIRWQRGMLDSIRLYGLRLWTLAPIIRVVAMYLVSLSVPAYIAFLGAVTLHYGAVPFDWRWTPLMLLFIAERMWTVRHDGWRSIVVALLFVPEWAYEQFRSFAYWSALWRTVRGKERVWINA